MNGGILGHDNSVPLKWYKHTVSNKTVKFFQAICDSKCLWFKNCELYQKIFFFTSGLFSRFMWSNLSFETKNFDTMLVLKWTTTKIRGKCKTVNPHRILVIIMSKIKSHVIALGLLSSAKLMEAQSQQSTISNRFRENKIIIIWNFQWLMWKISIHSLDL